MIKLSISFEDLVKHGDPHDYTGWITPEMQKIQQDWSAGLCVIQRQFDPVNQSFEIFARYHDPADEMLRKLSL